MKDHLGNNILNGKRLLISSQNLSQKFAHLRNIQPYDTTNVKRSAVKHWLLLSDCSEMLIL
jgi:hypothetical protein